MDHVQIYLRIQFAISTANNSTKKQNHFLVISLLTVDKEQGLFEAAHTIK